MILRRIQVEGFKCFANPVEVGPFDERLNILFGPNGKGKSTLLAGMTRGLMDTYNLGGAEAQRQQAGGQARLATGRADGRHDRMGREDERRRIRAIGPAGDE